MWSLKDDEYQTSYDEQRLGEHGVQQEDVPEEQAEAGGEEQQEEEEEDTAKGFDTEEVCHHSPDNTLHFVLLWIDSFFENLLLKSSKEGGQSRPFITLLPLYRSSVYLVLWSIQSSALSCLKLIFIS